ncbi:restriction endonuclease subunit S [[Mycoplasma] anseris]|uniref:Restriction endonuclease subunit S n=1 Tax=[Mycoplasma] anseris TaxID=92400 RepID=A0A2Z4NDH6_9BACT|nr:restriction endonuclease subunit S [[Mycoplasma] anseris]AWX69599.1 restriction endonuclease subunit S [[Mycoplasma] anseris]
MNKILELIKNEKVEWKKLWEITIWDKKFNGIEKYKQEKTIKYHYYLASELDKIISKNGNVKILTTNICNLYTEEKYVKDTMSNGEVICIPWGGNPIIQYYNGKFVTSDNRIAVSNSKETLNMKYLYYYLLDKLNVISSFYRGSGIKHPDMKKVLDLEIPIPSLETQEKIVHILDNFTNYVDELSAELSARNSQYEYYRNMLLSDEYLKSKSINNNVNIIDEKIKWKNLGDVCEIKRGIRITKKELISNGNYPVVSGGVEPMGYFNKWNRNENTITIAQYGLAGFVNWQTEKFWANDVCYSLFPNEEIIDKFLFYLLKCKQNYIYSISNRTAIPYSINIENILNLEIAIPSLNIQNQIVKILDKFSELAEDTKGLLPKEIEQRQKQYEYYREKLLSFGNENNIGRERERERERERNN